jgi:hypothetical protein
MLRAQERPGPSRVTCFDFRGAIVFISIDGARQTHMLIQYPCEDVQMSKEKTEMWRGHSLPLCHGQRPADLGSQSID